MNREVFVRQFICLVVLFFHFGAFGVEAMDKSQLEHKRVKVAAVQMTGSWIYPQAHSIETAEKVVDYIDRAAAEGVDLIAFPELLLGKFKVPSPETELISKAAARGRIYVIAGCFEVLNDQGEYANSSLLFDRQGEIIGRFFKMHPAIGAPPFFWPPNEDDPEWKMKAGTELPVFDLDFGRLGILTCYDGYFPETFRGLCLKGAEILVWMNARNGAVEDYIVRASMAHNYVHMICTNKAIGMGTMIAEWPNSIPRYVDETGDAYISYVLDLEKLRYGRKYAREFYQRRPENYGAVVDELRPYTAYENLPDLPGAPTKDWSNIAACGVVPGKVSARGVSVEPVVNDEIVERQKGLAEGTDLYRLAFYARAPWMKGKVEFRFPEYLKSDAGYHYIDHYLSTITPLGEPVPFPRWKSESGGIYYEYEFPGKLKARAKVVPGPDEVSLEYTVTNAGNDSFDYVEQNCCLNLGQSPLFGEKFDLGHLYAVFDGKLKGLDTTTPTPEQVGREPWLIILTPKGEHSFEGPKDTGTTWWRVDQAADENLMAAVSADGERLIGYTWDVPEKHLMTNCGNPCLHTGPGAVVDLGPGESFTWRGKIYFMDNDADELLRRYRKDQERWKKSRGHR